MASIFTFRLPEKQKQEYLMIYLQLSTGQSPAECQFFAKHIFHKILKETEKYDLSTDIISETPSKYGLLSAVVAVSGSRETEFAARWLGSLQWIAKSPFRPNHLRKNWFIAVSRLPELPALPENHEIRVETCRSGGKGGQHVNKTESAVRAVHLSTGVAVRVESERSQHANKISTANFTNWNAVMRFVCFTVWILWKNKLIYCLLI
ncbi:peptide chain release factor H [Wielerella bovis]|uniref:peptide chain release factor H n=1 Tax=Wielerella bovis TaxID=2917790 RepID=UPI003211E253